MQDLQQIASEWENTNTDATNRNQAIKKGTQIIII
jgi:hypothetical protein